MIQGTISVGADYALIKDSYGKSIRRGRRFRQQEAAAALTIGQCVNIRWKQPCIEEMGSGWSPAVRI